MKYVPRNPRELVPLGGREVGKDMWMGHMQSVQSGRSVQLALPGDNNNGLIWGHGGNPYQVGGNIQVTCQIGPAAVIAFRR